MELMAKELRAHFPAARLYDHPDNAELVLETLCPLNFYDPSAKGRLYIGDQKEVSSLLEEKQPGKQAELYLLCLGDFQPPEGCEAALICCPLSQCAALYDLWQAAESIMRKYGDWRETLRKASIQFDMHQMLAASVPIFSSTLSVINAAYQWIDIAGPVPDGDLYDAKSGGMPIEMVAVVREDRLGTHELREPYIAPDPFSFFVSECLCYNLFISDQYYGRIIAYKNEPGHRYLKSEHKLMSILGETIQALLDSTNIDTYTLYPDNASLYLVLEKMFRGEATDKENLLRFLPQNHKGDEVAYEVGYLSFNQEETPAKTSQYYAQYINSHFENIYAVCLDNAVALLFIREARSQAVEITKPLSAFVRDNILRLGLSLPFSELDYLSDYLRQAEMALAYGSKRDEMKWIHFFSDYLLEYFYDPLYKLNPRTLCAEEVLKLQAYDRTHNTNYYETLKAYIDFQLNAIKTAKALYIHHATMVYRLKRIQEISQIDFSSNLKLIQIALSFRILGD